MASEGRPYRRVEIEGYEVLIGKGALENDILSLQIAAPNDLWLHVASGVPGSHVIVKNPDGRPVPRTVVEEAAALAAWYSKARHNAKVEVHQCLARDVSKPKGAPAGRVTIRRFSTLRVAPKPAATAEADDG